MLTIALIIGAIILAIIIIVVLILVIRAKRFKPTANKLEQLQNLNEDIGAAGFSYDLDSDYFLANMECWQREAGYCRLYDDGAPLFNMIIDCEPITFSYGGKRWLIELWKGQYGILTGCEIGIYNTCREDIKDVRFTGTFYENIDENEMLSMSLVLKKKGKVLLERSDTHWWLTAFKLGVFSQPDELHMEAVITFPNQEMCDAFIGGLCSIGYLKWEYTVEQTTVSINYTKPHTRQVFARNAVQEAAIQLQNKNYCKLYTKTTKKYKNTLDKLECLKPLAPHLYNFFVNSIYAKGLFEALEWIKDLIFKEYPCPDIPPEPCPPEPCPPEPCPPEPCPPEPCPPEPCPPEPCPPEPCPPEPCPPEPCPPEPCPPEPCPPEPCPPEPCPPEPCPPKPCQSDSCPMPCRPDSCPMPCQPDSCPMPYPPDYYRDAGHRRGNYSRQNPYSARNCGNACENAYYGRNPYGSNRRSRNYYNPSSGKRNDGCGCLEDDICKMTEEYEDSYKGISYHKNL